ncbi:MAG: electron transfer flavoprotein subunit alpha, partial [Desulforhopalus sp.]
MEKKKDIGAVWVVAELKDTGLQAVSLQLIGKARKLADQLGVAVEAVLLGEQVSEAARLLIASGVDTLYLGESADLKVYQSDIYAEIIVELAKEHEPEILLLGSTFMGRELAPIIAA